MHPGCLTILSKRWRRSASSFLDRLAGSAPMRRLVSSAARAAITPGLPSSSEAALIGDWALAAASASMRGTVRSRAPSSRACAAQAGRTTSKLTRAPSSRAVEPCMGRPPPPGVLPCNWRSMAVGPVSSLHSSRSAWMRGARACSCIACANSGPRRTTLQRAPAARPQSRQLAGFNWRLRPVMMTSRSGDILSLKAALAWPAKQMLPSELTASSAGLCACRPSSTLSSASSMLRSPRSTSDAACFALASKPGGRMFSLVSRVAASRRSRMCGSG
mmetsp:Transcript_84445/g.217491  ORF Transcript_84445/g.217491 Transcript_84445/m.217491 type:complete len:274 (+) Transcript_84445:839-1660(+)